MDELEIKAIHALSDIQDLKAEIRSHLDKPQKLMTDRWDWLAHVVLAYTIGIGTGWWLL